MPVIGNWQLTNEVHYVYDGNLVVQERGGNNNPVVNYTRGLDLSVSLEGAGGIGGLLAMTRQMPGLPPHYYYHSDGNGNVTMLINTQQLIVAKYLYEPFGNLIAANGPLADVNLYRFSSKEAHPNSGLVYYLYRFYEPTLQRWGNRDPLGELGGINLYGFVANNPVILIDAYGLAIVGMPTPVPPGDNSIVCKGGKPIIQNNNKGPDRKCTQAHEEQHLKDWKDRYGNDFCKGIKDGLLPTGGDGYSEFRRKSECMAFKVGKKCREDLLKSCNAKDKAAIQAGIDRDNKALKDNKCD